MFAFSRFLVEESRVDASRVRASRSRRGRLRRQMRSSAAVRQLEWLEERHLLNANPVRMAPPNGPCPPTVSPLTSYPTGYTPAQIRSAYGISNVSYGGVTGDGTGQTIAIVVAYHDPNMASDLHQFDVYWTSHGYNLLDAPSFTELNQNGQPSPLPGADSGWAGEETLDVEWAHTIAPRASIVVVEANSDYDSDLYPAVDAARNYAGVSVVSMSWGSGEFPGRPPTTTSSLPPWAIRA